MDQHDKLNSQDRVDAAVVRGAALCEQMHVHGRYDAVLTGPIESRRGEYIDLRDAMLSARRIGDSVLAAHYAAQLAQIPTEEKWRDVAHNLVTTAGKNDILDKYCKGSSYTQTLVMGLKGTGTAVAADTQASHAGWLEVGGANAPVYTGNRPAQTFNSASAGANTAPTQAFAITSTGTVAGCFMNNGGSSTKDNTTGILFSAGDFTAGSKAVGNGDTLNVSYSLSV